ncbi:MAG: LysR substrate-binding domain-containing protein [Pseudomonadota bacterium]
MRQLEVFNALIEAGSVSRAASRLNLTQPAVSVALSSLEQDLGFRLFHRSKGYFAPTGEALLLHAEAEQSLLAKERVETRAQEIRAGVVGGVSIASNGALAFNLLPWVFAEFQKSHPNVNIDLKIRSSRQIASWVLGRQIDIGLIDAPVPVTGLEAELIQVPCVCVLLEDDALAKEEWITPAHLSNRSVISITGDHSVDRQLDQILSSAGITVNRNISCSYFAIARNLVRAGAGVAIVDSINGLADLGDGVCWRPIKPAITFQLALITATHLPLQQSAHAFATLLRKRLMEKVQAL